MQTFKIVLYLLCLLSSMACAILLFRAYFQKRTRLLFWSALCFIGLTINNILLFLDIIILPAVDLRAARLSSSLIGMLFLLYGFVWESE